MPDDAQTALSVSVEPELFKIGYKIGLNLGFTELFKIGFTELAHHQLVCRLL